MRFNEREMIRISEGAVEMEGMLQYMRPQGNDWSDWYQQPAFKERIFKLVNNLLFYFRANEQTEPIGLIVLENMQVAYESPGPAFAFSLIFNDGKHIFACRCQEDLNRWVSALKTASYNYWRSLYTMLQAKISIKSGSDPVLHYLHTQTQNQSSEVKRVSKSTFYSITEGTTVITTNHEIKSVPTENLIDL